MKVSNLLACTAVFAAILTTFALQSSALPFEETQGQDCCAVEGPTIFPYGSPNCALTLGNLKYKAGKCEFWCSDELTPCKLSGTANGGILFLAANCGSGDLQDVECGQGGYFVSIECSDSCQ